MFPDSADGNYHECAQKLVKVTTRGSGVYGYVDEMIYEPTGEHLAVKIIFYEVDSDDKKATILQKCSTLKTIDDPNVVKLYGLFFFTQTWLCMELLDIGLDTLYPPLCKAGKNISEAIVGKIALSIVHGLEHLCTVVKMTHGDVTPSAMLANVDGSIKITSADVIGTHLKMMVPAISCCPLEVRLYNPPDHLTGHHGNIVDSSADVWGLGISIMEISSGKFPYDIHLSPFEQLREIVQDPAPTLPQEQFSPAIRDFISLCLVKAEDKRASYKQLLQSQFLTESKMALVDMQSFVKDSMDVVSTNKAAK